MRLVLALLALARARLDGWRERRRLNRIAWRVRKASALRRRADHLDEEAVRRFNAEYPIVAGQRR
ncbi:hypothetical protein EV668_1081 [Enterovirga rhinocerotis]|uniref:Uncharacterized protein n=1 Tax=Enterovirga rhinocerotis TaxID=1339210 RepID=A0A4R7C5H4_9HYPH|nr:hypothetical protein EV668_1081 [Enterovirga rhinocerotis]